MAIMVVVDAFGANGFRAGLAEVVNHFSRVLWTRNAFKATVHKRLSLF